MPEQLLKLSPDRDLQCYFLTPSAIAAMSAASSSGFTISGKWRQQFDWAVVEWNRDNVFEHPALRYLPDGDLSGLILTYQEQRTECIPLESNLVPTVSWNTLRIWTEGVAQPYEIDLVDLATPVMGSYVAASASMSLKSSPGVGRRVGLGWLDRHYYYTVQPGDDLTAIARGIASNIQDSDFTAAPNGQSVQVSWKSGPNYAALRGANGNRITIYGFAEAGADCWTTNAVNFSGGQFPTIYQIKIDFGALKQQGIRTDQIRKLRWTWAADLQAASFDQTEFQVTISQWTVIGSDRSYSVAGAGSFRVEDTDENVIYNGIWGTESGNYSGSRIHHCSRAGSSCVFSYSSGNQHYLYLGTRLVPNGGTLQVSVDGGTPKIINCNLAGEDILVRIPLGQVAAGQHAVTITHAGPANTDVYIDFLEIAIPATVLPDFDVQTQLSLASDWDTYHSQSLPAERTAWLIQKLGFHGRVNHYVGALWFYEITRPGTQYATLTMQVIPQAGMGSVGLDIASAQGQPTTTISHLVLRDDSAATVALALAGLINAGTNLVWASAAGDQVTLTARAMGTDGNGIWVQPNLANQGFTFSLSSNLLAGGIDGTPYSLNPSEPLNATLTAIADFWRTDVSASPRLNRAARDWHLAYFKALKSYGLDCVAAFSTELMNGDPSPAAGLAQRYPDGTPVILNTPAIQTNFSPAALNFWKQAYLDMASLQHSAGLAPYLQSGEVQWWYFPLQTWDAASGTNVNVGMPFYDSYTQQQYRAEFNSSLPVFTSNTVEPATNPTACAFLADLIGTYTAQIRAALRAVYPSCRYEVLYPNDTNAFALNQAVNYPGDWTAGNLTCLKTESFGFTLGSNLDQVQASIAVSAEKGFSNLSRSHLVGISDSYVPWMKEVCLAMSEGLESVVLFALDQYCLIGYAPPPFGSFSRSQFQR